MVLAILISIGVAATAATASAAPSWWVENKELGSGESQSLLEEATVIKAFLIKVAAFELEIECKTLKGKGSKLIGATGAAGKDEAEAFKFGECKILGALGTKCEVQGKEAVASSLKSELLEGEPPKDKLSAKTGETLGSLEIVNKGTEKCPVTITGKNQLTGSVTAKVLEPVTEQTHHVLEFAEASGSTTLFRESEAKFTGNAELFLTSGKKWSVLALPPAPRPEWVDFKGNRAVSIDHTANTAHGGSEAALKINEYGAAREVEWESPKAGEVVKNWPVVYLQTEAMKVETRFAVEKATREYLEKKVEGEPEITGETAVGGTAIKFAKKFTIAALKKQFEAHAEYITTEEMAASAVLPAKVLKSFATITWKWSVKPIGRVLPIEQELGKSTHNFYLIYETPLASTTIYLTLLDLETSEIAALGEPLSEEKVIKGVWEGFKRKEKAGGCLTLECSTVRIRTYNPATGAIANAGNSVLWYYEQITPGLRLNEYRALAQPACRGRYRTIDLLARLSGECGAWARAFKNALATEGIASTQLRIYAKYPETVCLVAEECFMLVKKWEFVEKGSSGEAGFPYTESEVEDENGLTGQGVENPRSFFKNHQIIEVGNNLYDPSYGSEPIGNGKEGEGAKNLLKYQEASITGFCKFVLTKWNCGPAEAGKLRLGSTVETVGETEPEEGETEEEL